MKVETKTCGHDNSSKLHRKILPTKNHLKRKGNKGDKFYQLNLGEKVKKTLHKNINLFVQLHPFQHRNII